MWRYDYSDSFNFWPLNGFLNIIVLALAICGLIYIFKSYSKTPSQAPKKIDEAMDILRRRYAAGEINAEEFAQKKKDLEG